VLTNQGRGHSSGDVGESGRKPIKCSRGWGKWTLTATPPSYPVGAPVPVRDQHFGTSLHISYNLFLQVLWGTSFQS